MTRPSAIRHLRKYHRVLPERHRSQFAGAVLRRYSTLTPTPRFSFLGVDDFETTSIARRGQRFRRPPIFALRHPVHPEAAPFLPVRLQFPGSYSSMRENVTLLGAIDRSMPDSLACIIHDKCT